MVAISIADFLFTDEEVRVFAETIKEHLLVRRAELAFGVAVRESDKKVYYGDSEYHECVVWPRDTPYLIRLLRRNREERLVREIIRSNLNHQMKEGFLFYNSELFSQDDGIVPVKNPVQFWSQWVDEIETNTIACRLRRKRLLAPPRLRTVRATFTAYGSSISQPFLYRAAVLIRSPPL